MNCGLLTLSESDKWELLLNALPCHLQDVYFRPSFYRLFENKQVGIANCFYYENEQGLALYPFLLNEVNSLGYDLKETYFDIQAPYGYNGILSTAASPDFLKAFSVEFKSYCNDQKIIAEMIRFNPVLKNEKQMPDVEAVNVLDNVIIDIAKGHDDVWNNSYEKDIRRILRRAEEYHLEFEYYVTSDLPATRLASFKEIYLSTMKRNNAQQHYYFNEDFFNQLVKALPNNAILFFALFENKPVSTELVLLSHDIAYPYLGGTLAESNAMNPNTFLRNKLLSVLVDRGIKTYSMGGGLSRNDSLYKYKKSFSKNGGDSPIHIGKRIHNEIVYKEVIKQWTARFPAIAANYQNYVLKYRYTA